MAYTHGVDNIPEIGDVVREIKVSEEGAVVDVYFESGKSVALHISSDSYEEVLTKFP